jgi:septal ring factor EnvC (AmiA/AmiB activator)
LEALHDEVTEVSQRLDSLVKGQQELASKLGKAEDAVSIFSSATHATQDLHEQLEKRIELQAGVIRTLHSSLQAREERLNRVLASFQALQSVSGEVSPPSNLPENL